MSGETRRGRLPAGLAATLLAGVIFGCVSGPPEIPVSVNLATAEWLEQLERQVVAGDYAAAVQTAEKLETEGWVPAEQLNRYLQFRTLAQIGAGQYAQAEATLDELERGIDDPAELHVLRGRLAAAQGNQTLAKGEYAKARQLNPRVEIPR